MYVMPGYLTWPSSSAVERVDASKFPGGIRRDGRDHWFLLSTFHQRGEAMPNFKELTEPCPRCWMVPSVSGECDCD